LEIRRAAGADQSGSGVEINAEVWKFADFADPGSRAVAGKFVIVDGHW
jgi:hypothetical protein